MLTNMENQLREQNATDRIDEVLEEMPRVREELGFIPLVTPTSQIVGSQSIVNVLAGERYRTITKETAAVLKGEYGRTPAKVNEALQKRVLDGADPVTCRPADLLEPEMDRLSKELDQIAKEKGIRRSDNPVEDVLIYALFLQIGLRFLKNRDDPDAFEPPPWLEEAPPVPEAKTAPRTSTADVPTRYRVAVNGQQYEVDVTPEGAITSMRTAGSALVAAPPCAVDVVPAAKPSGGGTPLASPLTGTVIRLCCQAGTGGSVG